MRLDRSRESDTDELSSGATQMVTITVHAMGLLHRIGQAESCVLGLSGHSLVQRLDGHPALAMIAPNFRRLRGAHPGAERWHSFAV